MKMILAMATALVAAAPASAATVVNLNGVANASLNGSNAVNVNLAAGTYSLRFTQDQYTAFTRFASVTGCDSTGQNCSQGYENSARYVIGGQTFTFGDGNANGGIGPISPGNGYFRDAATSFANSTGYLANFTLASAGTVGFFIYDDFLSDNSGGISLSIAAVPEPASWAMMVSGFGLLGAALRRQRKTAAFA